MCQRVIDGRDKTTTIMQVKVQAATISGTLPAPASKSVMQRVCGAALLHKGVTVVRNYGKSNDDKAALSIIAALGARVSYDNEHALTISSDGIPAKRLTTVEINCHESGLSLRMFAAIANLFAETVIVNGSGSLLQRPVDFFQQVLPQLGISVSGGKLPIELSGTFQAANISIDGSMSSQYLTGLLMAYSATDAKDVTIEVQHLKSKPYIDLTLEVLERFKKKIPDVTNYESFAWKGFAPNAPGKIEHEIEGDWSNGAFLLVAGAIAGSIIVKGLDVFTTQADKRVLEALQDSGCIMSIEATQIQVRHAALKAFHFDATDCPDLFPPLVALAAHCSGTSVIEGVHRLEHKESNRAESLIATFSLMGVEINIQDDKMIIKGAAQKVQGAIVDSYNDHRIAMACAVAALGANSPMTITGADAVNKSYPDFFNDLSSISAGAITTHL